MALSSTGNKVLGSLVESSGMGDNLDHGKGIIREASSSSKQSDPSLSIHGSDDEEEVIWEDDIGKDEANRLALGLICKIWTSRMVNPNAFISTINGIWALKHGLEISNIGKNLYQLQFHHWRDKNKVVDGQPWHFDHHALIMGDIGDLEKPSEADLYWLLVWVRFYDIPFKGRQNESNALILGNKVGQFVAHDKRETSGLEKSLRIRVLIDVRKPLKKSINLKMRGGVSTRVTVKYERIPLFCYFCGRLGHGTKDCDESHGDGSPIKHFSGSLKASPWRPVRELEDVGSGEGTGSCARHLFIVQPKVVCKQSDQGYGVTQSGGSIRGGIVFEWFG